MVHCVCQIFAIDRGSLHFNALADIVIINLSLKTRFVGYISLAECVGVSSTTFT